MSEKQYKKRIAIGVICNIVGLFIFGYIFSLIAYSQFDKNYKDFINDKNKRRTSLWGKVISVFFIMLSLSYHTQSKNLPLDERTFVACIIGSIFMIIAYFTLNSKDKKNIDESNVDNLENQTLINDEKEIFRCSNCGYIVDESAVDCTNCGESFDDDEEEFEKSDIDKKYFDLIKLKELLDKDIISKEEFNKEKKKILSKK